MSRTREIQVLVVVVGLLVSAGSAGAQLFPDFERTSKRVNLHQPAISRCVDMLHQYTATLPNKEQDLCGIRANVPAVKTARLPMVEKPLVAACVDMYRRNTAVLPDKELERSERRVLFVPALVARRVDLHHRNVFQFPTPEDD